MTAPAGLRPAPGRLDAAAQRRLLDDVEAAISAAPLFTPRIPRTGQLMSVRMTNCEPLGWVTDEVRGYRHQATPPRPARHGPPSQPPCWR